MISVTVKNRNAVAVPLSPVTSGAVGIPVHFKFSEDWMQEGITRVACFRVPEITTIYSMILDETGDTVVPWELLEEPGRVLFVGAFGDNSEGSIVIPTVWANAGLIEQGTMGGEESADPTPTQWTQIRELAQDAADSAAAAEAYAEHQPIIENGYWETWNGEEYESTGQPAGLIISGTVATVQDLPSGMPTGTFYNVGTQPPYTIYMFDGTQWTSQGQLQGPPGEEGVSPEVTITPVTGGHAVTITDAEHPSGQSFNVLDGEPGQPGSDGDDGTTFTPSVSAAGVISWTNDGGKQNPDPVDIKGPKGDDGFSPTVSSSEITGGHSLSITSSGGTTTFNVMDGTQGPIGPAGVAVQDSAPTSNYLVWVDTDEGSTKTVPEIDDVTPSGVDTYSSNKVEAIAGDIRNTLNQLTRPNLLDNWYFGNPVNQRGNLIYSNTGYTIDRWSISAGTLSIQAGDIEIGADISFYQVMGNAPVGKLVTMTILTASGELITGSGVIPSSGSVTFAYDGNRYSIYYLNGFIAVETYNTALTLVAAKAELGSGQTLAHQENGQWVLNEIPNYDEQLYRCCASTGDPSDTYANKPYNAKADEDSLALRRSGATNTEAQIENGTYFYLDGTLKHAIATIAQNASFTAQNCETVTAGGLNALNNSLQMHVATRTATTDSDGLMSLGGSDISNYHIVSVYSNTGTYIFLPLKFTNIWHVKVFSATSFTPKANTQFTVNYCYFK